MLLHFLLEALAYAVGFRLFVLLRRRVGDPLPDPHRWVVVAAAAVGAALGSKLLALAADPADTMAHASDLGHLLRGKTIVGGLVGGLVAVEFAKRRIGVMRSTGDLFAVPLCVGIAIGRVGCFLAGLEDRTYGVATDLPWGVDFGDGVARHPTQLYEAAFVLALGAWLLPRTMVSRVRSSPTGRFTSSDPKDVRISPDPFARGVVPSPSPTTLQGRPPGSGPSLGQTSLADMRTNSGLGTLRPHAEGTVFRTFLGAYLAFRLAIDFLKPGVPLAGLTAIQWVCVAALVWCVLPRRATLQGAPAHG